MLLLITIFHFPWRHACWKWDTQCKKERNMHSYPLFSMTIMRMEVNIYNIMSPTAYNDSVHQTADVRRGMAPKCSSCRGLYDSCKRLPLLLPNCGHTCCKACLERLVQHRGYLCSVCRWGKAVCDSWIVYYW